MSEFDYDINKYMEYRKAHRDEVETFEEEPTQEDKKELSEGAKRFIRDIVARIDYEEI